MATIENPYYRRAVLRPVNLAVTTASTSSTDVIANYFPALWPAFEPSNVRRGSLTLDDYNK